MARMTNKEWQKYGERYALTILTDELKIPHDSILESESPDFIFRYEGKWIGAEVVEYHRSPKETEARKAYQKAIDQYKGKKGKLTSVIVFVFSVTFLLPPYQSPSNIGSFCVLKYIYIHTINLIFYNIHSLVNHPIIVI